MIGSDGGQNFVLLVFFVGNVLGAEGQMDGWVLDTTFGSGKRGIWMLGWDAVERIWALHKYETAKPDSANSLREAGIKGIRYMDQNSEHSDHYRARALMCSLPKLALR